jgi:hypothetical protein
MTGASNNDLRYATLATLEKILHQLVEHHGARMTLGEMLAITAAMARLCKKDRVTIAEIAEATGLPKQSLSRWTQKRIGDSIVLKVNEEDHRVHDVTMLDHERGRDNVARLAEIMQVAGMRANGAPSGTL